MREDQGGRTSLTQAPPPFGYTTVRGENIVKEDREYSQGRLHLVDELLAFNSHAAVAAALHHLLQGQGRQQGDAAQIDNHQRISALLLRLGRDQACYDHLSRWKGRYMRPREQPSTVSNCDAFEPVDTFKFSSLEPGISFYRDQYGATCPQLAPGLEHIVPLTLLKIKLLLDLHALDNVTIAIQHKFPPEIMDAIRKAVPVSDAIPHKLICQRDLAPVTATLRSQIVQLFRAGQSKRPGFWDMLVDPDMRPTVPLPGHIDMDEGKQTFKDDYQHGSKRRERSPS